MPNAQQMAQLGGVGGTQTPRPRRMR
jgi:hypothetical protein